MSNDFKERTIKRNKTAEPFSSGKYRKLDNFKFACGLGANWVDHDAGILYHIQEYRDAIEDPKIPQDKKPTKIRMTRISDGTEIGWADEYFVAMKMKDPEPDPRY